MINPFPQQRSPVAHLLALKLTRMESRGAKPGWPRRSRANTLAPPEMRAGQLCKFRAIPGYSGLFRDLRKFFCSRGENLDRPKRGNPDFIQICVHLRQSAENSGPGAAQAGEFFIRRLAQMNADSRPATAAASGFIVSRPDPAHA